MPFLIFLAVVIAGAASAILLTKRLFPGRGPVTPIVRIGIAAGEAEARIWTNALHSAGIWHRVRSERTGTYGDIPFSWEIWGRERDNDCARGVLGIN